MPLDQERDKPFWAHLEDLRWHLWRSTAVVFIFSAFAFWKIEWLVGRVLLGPLSLDFPTAVLLCRIGHCPPPFTLRLQATHPSEQFVKAVVLALSAGLVIAFPYIVWEIWRFIRPGLYRHERRALRGIVFYTSLLFMTGVLFAYFILVPFMMYFFGSFRLAENVENIWRIGDVISLTVQTCLVVGLVFQMPVLLWGLSQAGIITARGLRALRRYAVLIAVILGGILTPSPDVISQLLLAIPLWGLYELSIAIVALSERRRRSYLPI
ncbi:MAG: twin-arginine translocase subunit TatC [Bacteroidia bacterium]|nr:twin-arginine translocase subunit TatC [Bacteroidia bacterium]MCX7652331.1 twin-arginine translocase subunit TatC [Bacteroidia bacterium]MDW8417647.1 twin-arginine translocase subunit TatC [Bacteroidia bacterium]